MLAAAVVVAAVVVEAFGAACWVLAVPVVAVLAVVDLVVSACFGRPSARRPWRRCPRRWTRPGPWRRGGGLAVDGQVLARVDEVGVAADHGTVVLVQLLPAAVDVLGVGDLGQGVAGGDPVAVRGGALGAVGVVGDRLGVHRDVGPLLGAALVVGGVRGRGGDREADRGAGHAGGDGDPDDGGQARLAVLALSGHGAFLSDACEVSCRVRARVARPQNCGFTPSRSRRVPGPASYLWFPRSCRGVVSGRHRTTAGLGVPSGGPPGPWPGCGGSKTHGSRSWQTPIGPVPKIGKGLTVHQVTLRPPARCGVRTGS
ncbi:hypothetical protein KCH_27710 [Kitasatospora cheerisanensis KCTC 2395]|uniref:Uncharacterized protein n=1 Tax=Kitasatospora cheerisanensis KCTC 2395 TaxID=1348663 RepID=A0A066Z5T4_9ACTN|nr:hypothetical protein KCH_27710 [Kitasatospora cheerisanensis KCTC 2395]